MDTWTGGPGFDLGLNMKNSETEDARVKERKITPSLESLKIFLTKFGVSSKLFSPQAV